VNTHHVGGFLLMNRKFEHWGRRLWCLSPLSTILQWWSTIPSNINKTEKPTLTFTHWKQKKDYVIWCWISRSYQKCGVVKPVHGIASTQQDHILHVSQKMNDNKNMKGTIARSMNARS